MFEAFIGSLERDFLWLLCFLGAALVLLIVVFFCCRGSSRIKYYCDLKAFYYALAGVWFIGAILAFGGQFAYSLRKVPLKELKVPAEKRQVQELCQHDFDERMKKAKTEKEKKAIRQELEERGIKVVENPGQKPKLSIPDHAKILQWQKDWVQLRSKVEKKLGSQRVSVPWEKDHRTTPTLAKRLNDRAVAWIGYMSRLRMAVWFIGWGIVCLVIWLVGLVTSKKGTPAVVEEQLLDEK